MHYIHSSISIWSPAGPTHVYGTQHSWHPWSPSGRQQQRLKLPLWLQHPLRGQDGQCWISSLFLSLFICSSLHLHPPGSVCSSSDFLLQQLVYLTLTLNNAILTETHGSSHVGLNICRHWVQSDTCYFTVQTCRLYTISTLKLIKLMLSCVWHLSGSEAFLTCKIKDFFSFHKFCRCSFDFFLGASCFFFLFFFTSTYFFLI